jgi:thiol-disulfide isomerase/thioredoxin
MKVLKFGAVWCSGCLVMRPRWQEIEKENPWLQTEYFDYDQKRDTAVSFGIESGKLPVFIFLDKDGKEIARLEGEISKKTLIDLINEHRDK